MTFPAYAARDALIGTGQVKLLDHTGHVRPELTGSQARALVRHINALRRANGWKPLDMRGRWTR